jgi:hypothetical protein
VRRKKRPGSSMQIQLRPEGGWVNDNCLPYPSVHVTATHPPDAARHPTRSRPLTCRVVFFQSRILDRTGLCAKSGGAEADWVARNTNIKWLLSETETQRATMHCFVSHGPCVRPHHYRPNIHTSVGPSEMMNEPLGSRGYRLRDSKKKQSRTARIGRIPSSAIGMFLSEKAYLEIERGMGLVHPPSQQ